MKKRTSLWLHLAIVSTIAAVCMSLSAVSLHAAKPVNFAFPAGTYEQTVEVTFKDAGAAEKATVRMAPLFDGRQWAVSSRWDDNSDVSLVVRNVLEEHAHKGTFYLNSWQQAWLSSAKPEVRIGTGARGFRDIGKQLLKGGNSIGGHTLTHPMLTFCSRNRIFEEMARVRIEWEAITNSRVLSHAFSFCNCGFWGNTGFIKDPVGADIAHILERAGYYHVATQHFHASRDIIRSPFMPHDGADIDGFVQAALGSEDFKAKHPNLTHAMHAWAYADPRQRKKFEGQLDKYGHNTDWWYCNQNEYAAYRYQYRHTKLVPLPRAGRVVRLRVERPMVLDLNDPTPLTFQIAGVSEQEVVSVQCATAECVKSDRPSGAYRFHLPHDRDQTLPQKIGLIANNDNRATLADGDQDPDFPGLRALLHFNEGKLRVVLDNRTDSPVTNTHITYRLPLAWNEGVVRRRVADVGAGSRSEDTLVPTRRSDDYKYNAGNGFFVAQVDFRLDTQPGRLHLSCHLASPPRDPSYPQGGFVRLGPLDKGQVDLEELAAALAVQDKAAGALTALAMKTRIRWEGNDDPTIFPYLSPEIIRTTGGWGPVSHQFWLLWASVESADAREVTLMLDGPRTVDRVFVNGHDLAGQRTAKLVRGTNMLVIVYHAQGNHNPLNAGCFLRVIAPGVGRAANIRFQQPTIHQ